eukprot:c12991_g1_i1.p1 GENE.c12991_g1_i1~~c12991_g1_i1.p1  ORF type:complete len:799 (+),score=137.94 c12991_g1_i1:88-2484(+)
MSWFSKMRRKTGGQLSDTAPPSVESSILQQAEGEPKETDNLDQLASAVALEQVASLAEEGEEVFASEDQIKVDFPPNFIESSTTDALPSPAAPGPPQDETSAVPATIVLQETKAEASEPEVSALPDPVKEAREALLRSKEELALVAIITHFISQQPEKHVTSNQLAQFMQANNLREQLQSRKVKQFVLDHPETLLWTNWDPMHRICLVEKIVTFSRSDFVILDDGVYCRTALLGWVVSVGTKVNVTALFPDPSNVRNKWRVEAAVVVEAPVPPAAAPSPAPPTSSAGSTATTEPTSDSGDQQPSVEHAAQRLKHFISHSPASSSIVGTGPALGSQQIMLACSAISQFYSSHPRCKPIISSCGTLKRFVEAHPQLLLWVTCSNANMHYVALADRFTVLSYIQFLAATPPLPTNRETFHDSFELWRGLFCARFGVTSLFKKCGSESSMLYHLRTTWHVATVAKTNSITWNATRLRELAAVLPNSVVVERTAGAGAQTPSPVPDSPPNSSESPSSDEPWPMSQPMLPQAVGDAEMRAPVSFRAFDALSPIGHLPPSHHSLAEPVPPSLAGITPPQPPDPYPIMGHIADLSNLVGHFPVGPWHGQQLPSAPPSRVPFQNTPTPSHGHLWPPPLHSQPDVRRTPIVSFFWDIENCAIPSGRAVFQVAECIRRAIGPQGSFKEANFTCYCDVGTLSRERRLELNRSNVCLRDVVDRKAGAADRMLMQDILKFTLVNNNSDVPYTIVLVSGDVDFTSYLLDLRNTGGYTVVLFHNNHAREDLKSAATRAFSFEQVLSTPPRANFF